MIASRSIVKTFDVVQQSWALMWAVPSEEDATTIVFA
jgi:hypothetical protein